MHASSDISNSTPNALSAYVGVVVAAGLKYASKHEFAFRHGKRLGEAVTRITGVEPGRYEFVAKALWRSISENIPTTGVFIGHVRVGQIGAEHTVTVAIHKDVTLMLGAVPTGESTAEFVLFTPCAGVQQQFTSDVIFIHP